MKTITKIVPMHLLEIKSVIKKELLDSVFFEIRFLDNYKLAVTNLHAFVLSNCDVKSVANLKDGDKIWVDVGAFSADRSLTKESFYGTTKKIG